MCAWIIFWIVCLIWGIVAHESYMIWAAVIMLPLNALVEIWKRKNADNGVKLISVTWSECVDDDIEDDYIYDDSD